MHIKLLITTEFLSLEYFALRMVKHQFYRFNISRFFNPSVNYYLNQVLIDRLMIAILNINLTD